MDSIKNKKRVEYFDISRGIAMIAVIIGHSLMTYSSGFLHSVIYAFHMPIFFIISGYFYRERTIKGTLKNGTKKLLLPYAVTILIAATFRFFLEARILGPMLGNTMWTNESWNDFWLSSILGMGWSGNTPFGFVPYFIGPLWFLMALFWTDLLMVIIFKISRNNEMLRAVMIAVISICSIIVSGKFVLPFSLSAGMMGLCFSYVGFLFRKFKILDKKIDYFTLVCLFLIFLAAVKYGVYTLSMVQARDHFIAILGAISGSFLLLKLSQLLEKKFIRLQRFLSWIGKYSLFVFIIHSLDLTISSYEGFWYSNILIFSDRLISTLSFIAFRLIVSIAGAFVIVMFSSNLKERMMIFKINELR